MELLSHPKHYFNNLRFVGKMLVIWPKEKTASKTEVFLIECQWWITFFNTASSLIPLSLAAYCFRDDSFVLTKTMSEIAALSEYFLNLIQFKVKTNNFQMILDEIDKFIENRSKCEDVILQKYIDRYKRIQVLVILCFLADMVVFSCMPLITSQLFPLDTWYPFFTESFAIRTFLYFSQMLAITQTALGWVVDLTVAMMLWYSTLQLELLEQAVSQAITLKQIKSCVQRYQKIIVFTNVVKDGIQFIILKSNILMLLLIITAAFQLIQNQPFETYLQFFILLLAGYLRLYLCIKPADDLIEQCENLQRTVCQTAFLQKSPKSAKMLILLGIHCKKPIILSVQGVIKIYNLQYFTAYLSKSVAYFMNLRIILDKNQHFL